MGPKKKRRSTVLSPMVEAVIIALRVQARLSLDDVSVALMDVIPQLTRSSLHRCLQRHGISRLPKADREKLKKFKAYEIGFCGCRPMCKRVLIECARDRVRSSVRPSYAAFAEAAGQYGDLRIRSKSTSRALSLMPTGWFS